jgi:hypothetical protein
MAASSSSAGRQSSAAFDEAPEWVQKTYARAKTLSHSGNELHALPKALAASKPVQGKSIDQVRRRVNSFPPAAQRRVADRFSPFTLKDAAYNLERYITYVEGRPVLLLGSNSIANVVASCNECGLHMLELLRLQSQSSCVYGACEKNRAATEVNPIDARDGCASRVRAVLGEQICAFTGACSHGAQRAVGPAMPGGACVVLHLEGS